MRRSRDRAVLSQSPTSALLDRGFGSTLSPETARNLASIGYTLLLVGFGLLALGVLLVVVIAASAVALVQGIASLLTAGAVVIVVRVVLDAALTVIARDHDDREADLGPS